jgi:hypothetical protein
MFEPCTLTRWGFYTPWSDGSRFLPFKLWFSNGRRTLRWLVLLSVRLWFCASLRVLGLRKGPMCPTLLILSLWLMRLIWPRGIFLKRVWMILWFSFTLAMQTKFSYLTRILDCTAKGHWPFLSRNLIVLVSLLRGLLGVHRGEPPGQNSVHHSHPHSHRLNQSLNLPHLRLAHGPLPSTCLGLHPGMLPVGISPCISRLRVAWLGLVQVVVSGPYLLVLPTKMRHLRRPGCAHRLVGLPSLRRWVSSTSESMMWRRLCTSTLSPLRTSCVCQARDFTPSSRHNSSGWRSRGLTFGGCDIPLHNSEPEASLGEDPTLR